MATKKQEVIPEEQAPMEEAAPQTEMNPELEEMDREEMHDAANAESPLPQTETEMTETVENSADLNAKADDEGALSQTETEEAKKARGRKKTAEKPSGSDKEAHSDHKDAGDGVEETPKPRKRLSLIHI